MQTLRDQGVALERQLEDQDSSYEMKVLELRRDGGRISGIVVGGSANMALAGANVVVTPPDSVEGPWGAATDRDGRFVILAPETGRLELRVTFVGHRPIVTSLD